MKDINLPEFNNKFTGFSRNLTLKSLGGLIALALIPALLLTSTMYAAFRITQSDRARTQVKNDATGMALYISTIVMERQSYLLELSNTQLFKTSYNLLANSQQDKANGILMLDQIFKEQIGANPNTVYIALYDPVGEVVVSASSTLAEVPIDYSDFAQLAPSTPFSRFENEFIYNQPNQWVMLSGLRVGESTDNQNYTFIEVNSIPNINSYLQTISNFFPGSMTGLYTDEGSLIRSPGDQPVSTNLINLDKQKARLDSLVVIPQPSGTHLLDFHPNHFTYAHNIPGMNTSLIYSIPGSSVVGLAPATIVLVITAFLICLLISTLAIWFFIRENILPVTELAFRAQKIADGEKIGKQKEGRTDEIGILANSLNRISRELIHLTRHTAGHNVATYPASHHNIAESGINTITEENDAEYFQPKPPQSEIFIEQLRFDREEANLLYRAAQKISRAKTQKDVFHLLGETLNGLDYSCAILDTNNDAVRLVTLHDLQNLNIDTSLRGVSIPLENSPQIFTDKEVIIFDSLLEKKPDFQALMTFFEKLNCSSLAVFPITVNHLPVRIFAIGSRKANPISTIDLNPYINLAQICSSVLDRLTGVRSLENQLDIFETLATISLTITTEFNLNRLYQMVHEKIADRIGSDLSFIIATYDEETRKIEIPYLFEAGNVTSIDPFPLGEGLTSILVQKKQSLMLVRNTEHEAQRLGAKIVGKPAKSWLGVPLMFSGDVIGAIILQDTTNEGRFSEKDLILVETLAPQIATAIHNAHLVEDLSSMIRALNQETSLLNALLDNVPEKIYFKDNEGRYLRVSTSFYMDFGFSCAEEMIGHSDDELIPGDAGYERHLQDMEIISTAVPSIGQLIERVADNGQSTWELVSRVPLIDKNGHALGLLCISQDISNLKEAEAIAARQAQYLYTAAEIARDITASLDLSEIMRKATNLIIERFGYYHASVFLIDASEGYAVLSESAGDIGQIMKGSGHRLVIGSKSLVGQATATGITILANNTRSNPDFYPNPLLPGTRAELVVPLKIGNRILGALDVQSEQINAFSQSDVHTLEILADQLAMTIENAGLYTKAQENLNKHRLLHEITTAASTSRDQQEALERIVSSLHNAFIGERVAVYFSQPDGQLRLRAAAGYGNNELTYTPLQIGEGIAGQTAQYRRPIRVDDFSKTTDFVSIDNFFASQLTVPIMFSDKLLGVLSIESHEKSRFDENDQEIMGALGNALGAIITNTELLSQIRRQIERQRQLYEITSKIRRSVDIETILRTSTSEIGRVMHARNVQINVTAGQDNPATDKMIQYKSERNNGNEQDHKNNDNKNVGITK